MSTCAQGTVVLIDGDLAKSGQARHLAKLIGKQMDPFMSDTGGVEVMSSSECPYLLNGSEEDR